MFELTKKLREWIVANRKVAEDASDDDLRMEAVKAITDGTLSPERFAELTRNEKAETAKAFGEKLDAVIESVGRLAEALASKEEKKTEVKEVEKRTDVKDVSDAVAASGEKATDLDGTKEFAAGTTKARLKSVEEIFDATTTTLRFPTKSAKTNGDHPWAGREVKSFGRTLERSELKTAYCGAFAKFQLMVATPSMYGPPQQCWERLPEIDKQLLHSLCEKGWWDDSDDERPRQRFGYPGGVKQLIDDAISGGFEAAPIVFDDMVIEVPLLYGELWPFINEVPLSRGRRVEGVTIGRVASAWGGVDATAIALFNTANYVAAFDTTIYRWQGSIQIGLDFLSDTPIDFGGKITRQYGEELLHELDNVVAAGNGTTQPQGVINAAGTTAVAFGGVTSLANYMGLEFGINKRELATAGQIFFVGTDTSYQRARSLTVTAADNRLLGGGEGDQGGVRSYRWLGRPFKINESLTNAQILCFAPKRWRGYRRRGLTVRTSTEGDTLIRANEMLVAVTARYGGQLERGAAAAVTTTAPA